MFIGRYPGQPVALSSDEARILCVEHDTLAAQENTQFGRALLEMSCWARDDLRHCESKSSPRRMSSSNTSIH